MPLSHEQIEAVIQWMNTWEQLKDTAIPMRFKEDFLHKSDDERLCEKLRREKIGDELKLISDKMDKKSKQELLQNPLVKEIAQKYAQKVIDGSLAIPKSALWDDFVKSNEPVREWEILEYLLEHSQLIGHYCAGKIKSVKRLSDGIVFSVGDITHAGEITSFEIQGQNMIAKGSDFEWHINQLEKDKLPLFITTDGKPVYEGDAFWQIYSGWGMTQPKLYRANNQDKIQYVQTFSTEQAAQEYITLNKPCLSVSDVTKIAGQYPENYFKNTPHIVYQFTLDELITLAKSKQANS